MDFLGLEKLISVSRALHNFPGNTVRERTELRGLDVIFKK